MGRAGALEYAYSGAPAVTARTIGCMLWSDPENNPPRTCGTLQAKMRRAGLVLALAMVVAMFVLGIR